MREIKFRYAYKNLETNKIIFQHYTIEEIEKGLAYEFIINYDGDLKIISRDEYTGRKDKNGKEIFENDFYRYLYDIYIVKFINGVWAIGDIETKGARFLYSSENGKIIGNIYQIPELLK